MENKQGFVYRFSKISISEKNMSNFLYAIFMTNSKLQSYHHLGLQKYTRKQNSGNLVNIVIEIKEEMINKFEELLGIKLYESEKFQGKMNPNREERTMEKLMDSYKKFDETKSKKIDRDSYEGGFDSSDCLSTIQ